MRLFPRVGLATLSLFSAACAAEATLEDDAVSDESALVLRVVASGQDQPCAIADDAANVYWLTCGSSTSVMRAPKAGGAPVELAALTREPTAIAVDATHVYWVDRNFDASKTNGVSRVAKSGGGVEVLATGFDDLAAIALTDDAIVVGGGGGVHRLPKSGGAVTPVIAPAPLDQFHSVSAPDVVTDGANVFFTHGYGTTPVSRVAMIGGAPSTVAAPRSVSALTLHGGFVYWMSEGALERAPAAGGPVQSVADLGVRAASALSVDDAGACAASVVDRVVRCVRFATGTVSTASRAWLFVPNRVSALAVDGDAVWVADRGAMTSGMAPSPVPFSGSIKRVARP